MSQINNQCWKGTVSRRVKATYAPNTVLFSERHYVQWSGKNINSNIGRPNSKSWVNFFPRVNFPKPCYVLG